MDHTRLLPLLDNHVVTLSHPTMAVVSDFRAEAQLAQVGERVAGGIENAFDQDL